VLLNLHLKSVYNPILLSLTQLKKLGGINYVRKKIN
jgi:hypothetical protein